MAIFDDVQAIIAKNLSIDKEKISLSSNLADDLGADSLDAVEIIMDLEDRFEISIADEATENIKTVQDLVDYIEKSQK